MNFKYNILLTGFLLVKLSVFSQSGDLKFKDIFEAKEASTKEAYYEQLSVYQRQDPMHASVYYQLGVIAQEWSKKYDPLTDFDNVEYFLYKVDLYYRICQKYLDEKEAKKNHIYYHQVEAPPGEKRPELQHIQADIYSKLDESAEYRKTVKDIRFKYFRAVANYSSCLKIFHEIALNNSKLKDIYLTADNAFMNKLNTLSTHFDSTIHYFDLYIEAINSFPIKDYNQRYTVVPIETYRLGGLTKSNFLENKVTLWNYKQWVKEVQEVIKNDVPELRNEIQKKGLAMRTLINQLNAINDYSANFDYFKLDDKFAYQIARFDYQPLILDLFYYNQSKINYLIDSKHPINNPDSIAECNMNLYNKLSFYRHYVEQKGLLQSRQANLSNNLSEYKASKYINYIRQNYGSYTGLQLYIANDQILINQEFEKNMLTLKKHVISQNLASKADTLKMVDDKHEIPLQTTEPNLADLKPQKYYTTAKSADLHGNTYATGFIKKKEKNTMGFISKADSANSIVWVKTFDFSKKDTLLNNMGMQIVATDSGCYALIHGKSYIADSLGNLNKLICLNAEGKLLAENEVGNSALPRYLYFDDVAQKVLMAFHGKAFNADTIQNDTLIVQYADSAANILWGKVMMLNGNLVDIVRSNQELLMVCNYNNLKIAEYSLTRNGVLGCAMTTIDIDGNVLGVKDLASTTENYVFNVIKLDSETLNFVGVKSSNPNKQELFQNDNIKLYYKLTNMSGEVYYSY